ncbi:MAG: tetratricopeptide repeat protein [Rickettsiaceae bacterium]|nr:tetratricopeptide repeat protein [Rickettsiaceae bacterium]
MEDVENINILNSLSSRQSSIRGFAISRDESLSRIEKIYEEAVSHYNFNNFEAAEYSLRSLLKITPIGYCPLPSVLKITDYGFWIIRSLHLLAKIHLAEEYFSNNLRTNNYPKAAGIFQYCAKFVSKYNLQYLEDGIEIDFLEEAYRIEYIFLSSAYIQNLNLQNPEFKTIGYEPLMHKERIELYKTKLDYIRCYISSKLSEIDSFKLMQISQRAKMTENLYQESMDFFINTTRYRNHNIGFLQTIIRDCKNLIGDPPCKYSIIGFGSLAGGKMTPWSDLEFAILIKEESSEYKEYFRILSILFHIAIINLGETPLRSLGVTALNDFRSKNKEDDWFWDDLTNNGLKFDGPAHYSCKTPLGRQGRYSVDLGNGVVILKPDFELILTPKQMAEFQRETNNREIISFETDPHLILALRSTILIDGAQKLLDLYRTEMSNIVSSNIVKSRAIEKLKEDIENFQIKLGDEEEGRLIEVKKDFFRISDRITEDLSIYYHIVPDVGSASLSSWEAIDKMSAKRTRNENKSRILSSEGANNLKSSLSIACELRLRTYAHNKGQIETMCIYEPLITDREIEKENLIKEIFYINDTEILHYFYCVMLQTQNLLREFCNNFSKASEINIKNSPLIDISNYTKAMIHCRFLEYDKALTYMELAKEEYSSNISFLTDLYLLYHKTGRADKAIDVMKHYIILQEEEGMTGELERARSCNDLAISYQANGNLEQACIYYHRSLEIYTGLTNSNIFSSNDLSILSSLSRTYSNFASLLLKQGDYENSIMQSYMALEIKLKLYINHQYHPSIAKTYANLAAGFQGKNDYEKAFAYYNESLAIYIKAYKNYPNHPSIAKLYGNLGSLSYQDKNYDIAVEYYNKSLSIYSNSYQHYPHHPSIASIILDLARSYFKIRDWDNSRIYCQKSLEIYTLLDQLDIDHEGIVKCNKLFSKINKYFLSLSSSIADYKGISRQTSLGDSQNPFCEEYLSQELGIKFGQFIFAESSKNTADETATQDIIGEIGDYS